MFHVRKNAWKRVVVAGALIVGGSAILPHGAGVVSSASAEAAPAAQATLAENEMMFVKEAAEGGMLEVALAQVALKNASSEEVKQFAQHMIDDHSKVNAELMEVAKAKNCPVPSEVTNEVGKAMLDMASKNTGPKFDKHYMLGQIGDHAKMEAMFTKAAKMCPDPEIKAFATKNLPAIQQHLTMAKQIAMNLK